MAEENKNQQPAPQITAQEKVNKDNVGKISQEIEHQEADSNNHPGMTPAPSMTQMKGAVGGLELAGALGDAAAFKARQHLLNPKDYKTQFKDLNPGKPPNNQDAFPVDLKIEEFEVHSPSCKIYELNTHVHGKEAAMAAMAVGDHAEKRIIKLENNMATLMRYLFRLGSRMHINCVYWGGTSPFNKYKCIRCMADDRISDGQLVQIDQCLTCTRYEPVFGQCYEIMNDLAANVATIMDDNQMAYANMEDYVELSRIEKMHEEKPAAKFDLLTVKTQDPAEQSVLTNLEDRWGPGIKMKWDLVPKEVQKCHINWRQSINDDGSRMQRLGSFPLSEANDGYNVTGSPAMGNVMTKNHEALENFNPQQGGSSGDSAALDAAIKNMRDEARNFAEGNKDDALNKIQGQQINQCKEYAKGINGLDATVLSVAAYITGENPQDIAQKYKRYAETIDTHNPAIVWAAYSINEKVILGEPDAMLTGAEAEKQKQPGKDANGNTVNNKSLVKLGKVPRIDIPMSQPSTSSGSGGNSGDNGPVEESDGVQIVWDQRESWLWTDFARRYLKRSPILGFQQSACSLFPKIVYLYKLVAARLVQSRFDTDEYAFPFTDEQFGSTDIWYTSPFGPRASTGTYHRGIDIACDRGVDIHAVHDGVVTAAGNGWGEACNAVNIDHGNGTYSRYLHCAEIKVSAGQQVSKGDVIATVGGTGADGPDTYPNHLHLEICEGGSESTQSYMDPLTYFPKFDVPKDGQITPA